MKLIYHASIPGNKDMNRKRSFCKFISASSIIILQNTYDEQCTFSQNDDLDLDCLHENSNVFAVYLTKESF